MQIFYVYLINIYLFICLILNGEETTGAAQVKINLHRTVPFIHILLRIVVRKLAVYKYL